MPIDDLLLQVASLAVELLEMSQEPLDEPTERCGQLLCRYLQLIADLGRRYPYHSVMQSYWLPTIRAQIALGKGDSSTALAELTRAAPLDLLYPQVFFYSHMPSVVLRAEAFRLLGQPARAGEQWQIIVRNPGITQLSATASYARRQLATAPAVRS